MIVRMSVIRVNFRHISTWVLDVSTSESSSVTSTPTTLSRWIATPFNLFSSSSATKQLFFSLQLFQYLISRAKKTTHRYVTWIFDFVRCDWFWSTREAAFDLKKKRFQYKNEFYRFSDTWCDCDSGGEESNSIISFCNNVCNVSTFFSFETPKQSLSAANCPRVDVALWFLWIIYYLLCYLWIIYSTESINYENCFGLETELDHRKLRVCHMRQARICMTYWFRMMCCDNWIEKTIIQSQLFRFLILWRPKNRPIVHMAARTDGR